VADKDPNIPELEPETDEVNPVAAFWDGAREIDSWDDTDLVSEFVSGDSHPVDMPAEEGGKKNRLDHIKESHALLKQFTPKELKILLNLKRNTSAKAWTLREDLVVLTLHMSNREIAQLLQDRNKEAVKKRLQLLKSKGLAKRPSEPPTA